MRRWTARSGRMRAKVNVSSSEKTAGAYRSSPPNRRRSGLPVADQRKMPHRRHRAALGEADAAVFGGPIDQPRPRKFRTPTQPARQRRKRQFKRATRAALGADMVDQNEFAAGFQHAD